MKLSAIHLFTVIHYGRRRCVGAANHSNSRKTVDGVYIINTHPGQDPVAAVVAQKTKEATRRRAHRRVNMHVNGLCTCMCHARTS